MVHYKTYMLFKILKHSQTSPDFFPPIHETFLTFPPSKQWPQSDSDGAPPVCGLPLEVNCVLLVLNLPFNISSKEMYDIFGRYGVVLTDIYQHQGRQNGSERRRITSPASTSHVAYRYLIMVYDQRAKTGKKLDMRKVFGPEILVWAEMVEGPKRRL